MYRCKINVLLWLSSSLLLVSFIMWNIFGLQVLMMLCTSFKVVQTWIPFPLFVFSPGLTIHIFFGILNSSSSESSQSESEFSEELESDAELEIIDFLAFLVFFLVWVSFGDSFFSGLLSLASASLILRFASSIFFHIVRCWMSSSTLWK